MYAAVTFVLSALRARLSDLMSPLDDVSTGIMGRTAPNMGGHPELWGGHRETTTMTLRNWNSKRLC